MATETFYKRIILSDEAAERLADGFDKPRKPFIPYFDMEEERKRSAEWLNRYLYPSKTSLEQAGKQI